MKSSRLVTAATVGLLVATGAHAALTPQQQLLDAYLELSVIQQIPVQAQTLGQGLQEADLHQIKGVSAAWTGQFIGAIRGRISSVFGERARPDFEQFVAEFTAAESRADPAYLQSLCASVGLNQPWPTDYIGLRKTYIENQLADTIGQGSVLLGEVQTWADLRRRGVPQTPDLASWLARSEPVATAPSGVAPASSGDPLRDMEAGFSGDLQAIPDAVSPLDSYGSMRNAKREKMLQEAQAGMQQVASERKAAEEEYASKRMAAAQKEAEAMKRHAEQLASVEQQALEQRQRSWGNRLKRIVGATISATGSAFLGDIGARAGTEAANALFNN